jgi:hypothetical protein
MYFLRASVFLCRSPLRLLATAGIALATIGLLAATLETHSSEGLGTSPFHTCGSLNQCNDWHTRHLGFIFQSGEIYPHTKPPCPPTQIGCPPLLLVEAEIGDGLLQKLDVVLEVAYA